MSPILETKSLTKRFGGLTATNNLDFSVGAGELRCLVGPNGAGKTTLFRSVWVSGRQERGTWPRERKEKWPAPHRPSTQCPLTSAISSLAVETQPNLRPKFLSAAACRSGR